MRLNNLFICLITLRLIETTQQFSQFTFNGTQYSCTKHSCIDSFYRAKDSDEWTYSFTGLKVAFKILNGNQEGILRESGIIQSFEDVCGADRICVRRCYDIDTVPRVSFSLNPLKEVEINADSSANSQELEYYEFCKFIVMMAVFSLMLLFLLIWLAIWLTKKLIGLVRWIMAQIKKKRKALELCDCECCVRQRTYNISCDCTCDCGGDCLDDYKLVQQEAKIGLFKSLL